MATETDSKVSRLPATPCPDLLAIRQHRFGQEQLDVGGLSEVWRVKEMGELNGAEISEAIRHIDELRPVDQTNIMHIASRMGLMAEQYLCLTCQGRAWTSMEHELFEADEHLGGQYVSTNSKLDPKCLACRSGSRGPVNEVD